MASTPDEQAAPEDGGNRTQRERKTEGHLWLTSWAVGSPAAVYLVTLFVVIFGYTSYMNLPKEQFPEVTFPTIMVTTVYPGASPMDVENLITRHLENEINTINGVKEISSNSIQDLSMVLVEFEVSADLNAAKQQVKDAVDKAQDELPSDLDEDPSVEKVEISDVPIMYLNLGGDFSNQELKGYAEDLQDRIERLQEINRVDIIGTRQREMHVNVDLYRMHAASISLGDIQRAIAQENVTISAGKMEIQGMQYAMRVAGEFENAQELRNMVVRTGKGMPVYLKDIAEVEYTFEEPESHARLNQQPGVTLNVIKRGGENLISAADKISQIRKEMRESGKLPESLNMRVIGDQSERTKDQLNNLINTIVIGFLLVAVTLMFFMGVNNALFVGLAVPLSAFITFMIIPSLGYTINTIVLFALLLALGILVDNAIVVVENIYRLYSEGHMNLQRSAKFGAAEVFIPVLAGTLTTLAPFFPLLFWPGVVGQFMGYLPATMIITLLASLFVAFVINPVFAVSFMKVARPGERKGYKQLLGNLGGIVFVAIILYLANQLALANFALTLAGLLLLTRFGIEPLISGFMRYILPGLERTYGRIVTWATHGRNAVIVLLSTVGLLVLSVVAIGMSDTKVTFFPESDPNFAYVYIDLPVGTDTQTTDSLTKEMEERVWQAIGKDTSIVEAMVTNVAVGAGDPRPTSFEQGKRPEKGKLSVAFVPYSKRGGVSSWAVLERIRKAVQGVPGAEISVEREQSGPPTGKPINIEVRGDNFEQLIHTSKRLRRFIDSAGVPGIENLQTDLELNKPEAIVRVDRERANRLGIQTATIGQALRTAINGTEVSKFREEDEQHPIILRLQEQYRENLSALQNLNITFRDRATGTFKQIPLSAVAEIDYTSSYGSVKRKDLKRVVTLSSNVKTGYNANEINRQIRQILPEFERPANFEIEQTGEQEEQQKAMEFLSNALIISVLLILFILTALFNAVGKVVIILSQVVFSIIGVLLGFAATGMELSVVMTGVGIVALAGIVVNNGILLLEFTDRLRARGVQTSQALIRGGEIRLRPVLLTATSTILGLVPLAIGFNIDFPGLFRSGEADIFFGGDSAAFWGPLAWTIIFGLLFATILTLVVVPAMYRIYFGIKFWQQRRRHQRRYRPGPEQLPLR